jgi:large repetitive protein
VWAGHRAVWHLTGFGDATGQGHTGTNLGGSTPSTDVAGQAGRARHFDGVNDRITVPHHPALSFQATDSFTLSAWVKPTTLPAKWQGLVTKTGYGLFISNTTAWVAGSPSQPLIGSAATTAWAQVAVVQDGAAGEKRVYVNGAQVATGAAAAAAGTGEHWLGGVQGVSSQYFHGMLDEVRLIGTAASAGLVTALFRSETDSLVTYENVP